MMSSICSAFGVKASHHVTHSRHRSVYGKPVFSEGYHEMLYGENQNEQMNNEANDIVAVERNDAVEQTGGQEVNGTRKTLFGILIVIAIALSWVGSTQFAQSTYSTTFNAPYFTTWFSTSWVIILYPLYFLPYHLVTRRSIGELFRTSAAVLGRRGFSIVSLTTRVLPFCVLWMVTNYLYVRALGAIDAADVTAIFSCSNAFVYIFSWIWLQQRISVIKSTAVFLSIGGIVLMAYSEGFKGPNAVGIILSLASAIGAALYKVLFKKVVGDATAPQVSLFLSCLGVLSTIFLWPIILLVYFTKYELIEWTHLPWLYLCGTALLNLLFNFFINFGIALTYPLFISLGIVLGIPVNALADAVIRGKDFGILKIVAAALIITGFSFLLIPNMYENRLLTKLCCRNARNTAIDERSNLISQIGKQEQLMADAEKIQT